jgi:hypothetical protein
VNDAGTGTGKTPPPTVVIKRSSQEDYNAKRFSSTKYSSANAGMTGGGIITVTYHDVFFDDATGSPTDAVRPVVEKNLLLVGLTMQYQKEGKGGLQDFGASTRVQFNGIDLRTVPGSTGGALPAAYFKRSFAYVRNPDGTMTGAAGYDGSTEPYDVALQNFNYPRPLLSITHSDSVIDFAETVSVNSAILFDSGHVFNAAVDGILTLNRKLSKGTIISFEKVRGAFSSYPYLPSVVSYELLADTNVIRIPSEELKYILDVLRFSTGVPKVFGVKYPFWLSVIESGVCDTVSLQHTVTGAPLKFGVYQYFEFGRKMYFK